MRGFIVLLVVLATVGCVARPGPGSDCDPCAVAEAKPVGEGAQAAAASAAGGQRVSQAPDVGDTVPIQPMTAVGRGQGATTLSPTISEGRVVATGAGVNQGLQVPTDALARTGGGAIPQVVQQYRTDIAATWKQAEALLADARCARAVGQVDAANRIMEDYRATLSVIREMQGALAVAESGCATSITNNYYQQGQRVVQSVVSGTDAGSPSVPISEGGARAAAEALSTGAAAVMSAPSSPAESLPPPFPPVAAPPEPLPSTPPAGAPPVVPTGAGG